MSHSPRLSIVVALISGRTDAVRRCLRALRSQSGSLPEEIVVPFDELCADIGALREEFPDVRFLPATGLDTRDTRSGRSREHHDRLRTLGLRAATGDYVALIEDHAYPSPTWGDAMLDAFSRHPGASAIGGAVECASTHTLTVAAWFCDFGRYHNPLPDRRAEFVSDTNVAYTRDAVAWIGEVWPGDYHEAAVHEAMLRAGLELRTTPAPIVWHDRGRLTLRAILRERFVWARSFAATRARTLGGRRWLFAAFCPFLPVLLTWRLARLTFARRRYHRRFLVCLPALLLFEAVWSAGELAGYVSAKPAGGWLVSL